MRGSTFRRCGCRDEQGRPVADCPRLIRERSRASELGELVHRRPTDWPAPRTFDPSRYAADRSGVQSGSYLPFGVGPRLCIGRDFALVESVLALAALLRGHRVGLPVRNGRVRRPVVEASVTLRPRGGLPLVLHRRADPSLRPPPT